MMVATPLPNVDPADPSFAEKVAKRLRAYSYTISMWEEKKAHVQAMIDEHISAREAFIARLPELPVWLTERGEVGSDCPE